MRRKLLLVICLSTTLDLFGQLSSPTWSTGSGPFDLTWTAVTSAKEYQLQWVFVDKYADTQAASVFSDYEGVTVTVPSNAYVLSDVYPEGKLYVRVRSLASFTGRGYNTSTSKNRSDWSAPKVIDCGGHEMKINWQYQVDYSETGKRSDAVTYFDGGLKKRQQLGIRYEDDNVMVRDFRYDLEGRSALSFLPAPTIGNSLLFRPQFSKKADGSALLPIDYSKGVSVKLGTSGGTSKYFSSANTDNFFHREYTADSKGYPYSAQKYTSDNTGRLSAASGFGDVLKIDGSHVTQMLYGAASPTKLRQLFGKNIGKPGHYKADLIRDENGQTSLVYKDAADKVVATSLSGGSPTMLNALPSNTGATTTTIDLSDVNNYDASQSMWSIVYHYTNTEGSNPASFTYDITGVNFTYTVPVDGPGVTPAQCSNCIYHSVFEVRDPNGNAIPLTAADGSSFSELTISHLADCNPYSKTYTFTATFDLLGDYTIIKRLSLVAGDVEAEVQSTSSIISPYIHGRIATRPDATADPDECATTCEEHCQNSSDPNCVANCSVITEAEIRNALEAECTAKTNFAAQQIMDGTFASPHPEQCHLDLCTELIDSKVYDALMNHIASYPPTTDPNYGYLNPMGMPQTETGLATGAVKLDPFFFGTGSVSTGSYYRTTMTQRMKSYEVLPDGTLASIWVYARELAALNGGSIDEWQLFKGLYQGLKQGFIEQLKARRNCAYLDDDNAIFTAPPGPATGSETSEELQSSIAEYCGNLCSVRVDGWLDKLKLNCPAVTDTQLNQIRPLLQAYCSEVCGLENPFATIFESVVDTHQSPTLDAIQLIYPCSLGIIAIPDPYKREWQCKEVCTAESVLSACGRALFDFVERRVIGGTPIVTLSASVEGRALAACISATPRSRYAIISGNSIRLSATSNVNQGLVCTLFLTDDHGVKLQNNLIRAVTRVEADPNLPAPAEALYGRDDYTGISVDVRFSSGTRRTYYLYSTCVAKWTTIAKRCLPVLRPAGCLKEAIEVMQGASLPTSCFTSRSGVADRIELVMRDQGVHKFCDLIFTDKIGSLVAPANIPSFSSFTVKLPGQPEPVFNNRTFVGYLDDSIAVFTDCSFWEPDCDSVVVGVDFPTPELPTKQDCIDDLQQTADDGGMRLFVDSKTRTDTDTRNEIYRKCMNPPLHEGLSFTIKANEYHYNLNEYDVSQNLVRTIPPEGVKMLTEAQANGTINPAHKLPTVFQYNSYNQVRSSNSPDGGVDSIWYNRAGLPRFSKNSDQSVSQYSYNRYDQLGRLHESGVLNKTTHSEVVKETENLSFPDASRERTEIVATTWDEPNIQYCPGFLQQHLLGRISAVVSFYPDGTPICASCYSYDEHGSVRSFVQDIAGLGPKRVDYSYDLLSGNIDTVFYQASQVDQFTYAYAYDADNRLVGVHTTRDMTTWIKDAAYFYYAHGPLARLELGDKLQGVDYTYTLDGKLKGVNSNTLMANRDPGKDGLAVSTNPNKDFGRDLFGYTIRYFDGDYTPIGSIATADLFEASMPNSGYAPASRDLFDGNIAATVNATAVFMQGGALPIGYQYEYDQLHRLTKANSFTGIDVTGNTWSATGNPVNDYGGTFVYDANGNIKSLTRNGLSGATMAMDGLTYQYEKDVAGDIVNNRLLHVNDAAPSANYTDDIEDQGTFVNTATANNYEYDGRGNLKKDVLAGSSMVYDSRYKLALVDRNGGYKLQYSYDGAGHRVSKVVTDPGTSGDTTYYYITDANQGPLAEYKKYGTVVELVSFELYGASRLGVFDSREVIAGGTGGTPVNQRIYELTNHTNNVMVGVSGPRTAVDINGDGTADHFEATTAFATDYYPYGSPLPGRTFKSSTSTHGFNGQRKDNQLAGGGNHYTATFWEYEPRLGRRWNVDPMSSAGVSGYASLLNNPLMYWDPFGDEPEEGGEIDIDLGDERMKEIGDKATEIEGGGFDFHGGEESAADRYGTISQGSPDDISLEPHDIIDKIPILGPMIRGAAVPWIGILTGSDPWSEDPDPFGPNVDWSSGLPKWIPPSESDPYRKNYATMLALNSVMALMQLSVASAAPSGPVVFQEPLRIGSSARPHELPLDLRSQLMIEAAMRDPGAGKVIESLTMKDSRWPASKGWVKMRQTVNDTEIHYLYNKRTGAIDDFKIPSSSNTPK